MARRFNFSKYITTFEHALVAVEEKAASLISTVEKDAAKIVTEAKPYFAAAAELEALLAELKGGNSKSTAPKPSTTKKSTKSVKPTAAEGDGQPTEA